MSEAFVTKTYQLTPTTKIDVAREVKTNKLLGIYILLGD
jgi:hypothetical protein